jgi:8-oxo-dGTP pyrophosphatase MutT (NUDIX family)
MEVRLSQRPEVVVLVVRHGGRETVPERVRDEVLAAGGIVLRRKARGLPEVAVVHRPKYDDWSFPKGKLIPDEDFLSAALREVEEETGFSCTPLRELDSVRYRDRFGRPKLVRYWLMQPEGGRFEPGSEVDELRWLTLPAAAQLLSYEHDRALVRSVGAVK